MYKDLSLREKAKVLLYGGKLGLTSVKDIAKLYDEAIKQELPKGREVVYDNNGYYTQSKDKDVIIKGENTGTFITTDKIPFEIDALDNLGNHKILEPNNEYYFPGSMVREHALQSGGLAKPFSYGDIPDVRYLKGGNIFLNGEIINRIKPIEEYITPVEPPVLDNTYVVRDYPYYLLPEILDRNKRLSDEEISTHYASNILWTMENPNHKGLNPDGTYSAYEDEAGFNFGPGLHAKSNNLDINKTYTKLELDSIASNIALDYMKQISDDLETMQDGRYAGARDTLSAGPLLTMLDIAYNVKPKNKGNMPQKWPNLTDSLINGDIKRAKENTYSGSTRRQNMRNQMIVYKPLKGITVHNEALGGNLFKTGGIHIKPENRGKFTALKKRTGHSASWFKAHGTPALKKMATFALNARHWNHKHQLGGPESIFDIYNTYNLQKQEYFNTLPIVNEQAGIGRIDLPEVVVTATDPNAWWTPKELPKYPASGALAQDWRTHLVELSIPAMWSGLPALFANAAGALGSTKGGLYIYHGLNALAPGTAEWASLPTWLKFGTAAADIAFTGTQGAKTVKNPTTENALYTALGLSPYIGGIANAAKNTDAAKRFGEVARYLWNNGKPFVRNIPYKESNYYRIVGEDAIRDAETTGLIRGSQQFPDGPYFSKGKNVWKVNDNDYVIEGTPDIDWINAKRYNGLYLHSSFGRGVINGDNVDIPRGTQGGILLLTGQEPALTEAMPYYMQSTKVPTGPFTYYKKQPVIGWRLYKFQYKPLTESGISMFEKIGESNPDKQGGLRSLIKGIGLRKNYNLADPHDYLRIQSERIGEPISDFYDHMLTYREYDKMHGIKRDSPYEFVSSNVHIGNSPDEDVIRMSYPYFRHEYPDVPEELADNYTGAHEWIHLINMRRGERYPMESYNEGVTEIPGIDYSISKSSKDPRLDKRTVAYLKGQGATEVNARTALLFNYFGLGKGKKITPDMVKYAKQNYVKDTGYDNTMTAFLSRITDPKAFADWANKNAGKLFTTTGIGIGVNSVSDKNKKK